MGPFTESFVRFLIGGCAVSAFSAIAGIFKPKSFAGLFGAAPSVAIATLGMAVAKEGVAYAADECRSMVAGAAALGVYSLLVSWVLMRVRLTAWKATIASMPVWFVTAFALWHVFLR